MTTQQERPYRNAHWTGDLAASGTRVYTRHYATREQAEADADRMAADGETVNLEVWDADLADDPVNQGWALYGHRAAAEEDGRAVTITPEQIADLRSRLRVARRAAHGDSNDAEIQSWQVVGEAIDDIIGAES